MRIATVWVLSSIPHPWQKKPVLHVNEQDKPDGGKYGRVEFEESDRGVLMRGFASTRNAPEDFRPAGAIFVPWSNVKSVVYAETVESVKKALPKVPKFGEKRAD